MVLSILIGLLCGILSGLGIGGGSLLMLWLTAAAATEQRTAQGINLLYFLPTAAGSLMIHSKNRLVAWNIAIPASVGGSITAIMGAWTAHNMNTELLRRIFGIFLLFVGGLELYKAFRRNKPEIKPNK